MGFKSRLAKSVIMQKQVTDKEAQSLKKLMFVETNCQLMLHSTKTTIFLLFKDL